jgi:hypothetical protein
LLDRRQLSRLRFGLHRAQVTAARHVLRVSIVRRGRRLK